MPNLNARIYALVRHIPPGKVLTYGGVAKLLGVPRGARAVGWALHALEGAVKNEPPVPWFRVVNASGRISTPSDEHGIYMQRTLLEAEGVRFDQHDPLKLLNVNAIMWAPSPWEVEEIERTEFLPDEA